MKKAAIFIGGNNLYHNLKQMRIKPSNLDLRNSFKFFAIGKNRIMESCLK